MQHRRQKGGGEHKGDCYGGKLTHRNLILPRGKGSQKAQSSPSSQDGLEKIEKWRLVAVC
jgi:hypothetical protein